VSLQSKCRQQRRKMRWPYIAANGRVVKSFRLAFKTKPFNVLHESRFDVNKLPRKVNKSKTQSDPTGEIEPKAKI